MNVDGILYLLLLGIDKKINFKRDLFYEIKNGEYSDYIIDIEFVQNSKNGTFSIKIQRDLNLDYNEFVNYLLSFREYGYLIMVLRYYEYKGLETKVPIYIYLQDDLFFSDKTKSRLDEIIRNNYIPQFYKINENTQSCEILNTTTISFNFFLKKEKIVKKFFGKKNENSLTIGVENNNIFIKHFFDNDKALLVVLCILVSCKIRISPKEDALEKEYTNLINNNNKLFYKIYENIKLPDSSIKSLANMKIKREKYPQKIYKSLKEYFLSNVRSENFCYLINRLLKSKYSSELDFSIVENMYLTEEITEIDKDYLFLFLDLKHVYSHKNKIKTIKYDVIEKYLEF